LAYRFRKLGHEFDRDEVDQLYAAFSIVADKKKEVRDEDLLELALNLGIKNKAEVTQ
jgi:2-isopropylmalate synthase